MPTLAHLASGSTSTLTTATSRLLFDNDGSGCPQSAVRPLLRFSRCTLFQRLSYDDDIPLSSRPVGLLYLLLLLPHLLPPLRESDLYEYSPVDWEYTVHTCCALSYTFLVPSQAMNAFVVHLWKNREFLESVGLWLRERRPWRVRPWRVRSTSKYTKRQRR